MQACGVEWKLQMPSTSRDIALNRVSHEKTHASYVLRHVGILLEMKGQEYETVDDAAAALNPATDAGAFLKQHFLWNLCTAPRMDQNQEFSARDNAAGSQPPQHDFCIDSARGRLGSCYSGSRPRSCGKRPRRVSHCTIVGLRQQAYDLASRVAAGDELRKGVDLDCLHRHSET